MRLGVEAALVGRELVPGDVEVDGGRIAAVGVASPGGRGIASPGFVDLQVNGFAGVDFLDADADGYARAGDALLETGVTAYLPTFITSPEERLVEALRAVPRVTQERGPAVLGAHVEGPFVSARRLGAHPPGSRRDPDVALAARLLAAGPVRLMTLAPELPGAAGLIAFLQEHGIVVSCGHSDATAAQAHAAFDAGVGLVTHLFNAMRPFAHREPGIAGAALTHPGVVVPLIVDGVHLETDAVRLAWLAAGERVALVTDAIAAAGSGEGDGDVMLGETAVRVSGGVARRRDDDVLAGSLLTMVEAVRNLHATGVPLADALAAASTVPCRALGLDRGILAPGAPADVVVLGDRLEVERVLVGGETRVAA